MSDFSEGSRKRDRHRRHRNRDGRDGRENRDNRAGGGARTDTPRDGRSGAARPDATREREPQRAREPRRERHEELPPLPKLPTPVCPRCSQPIQDITSALADKESGEAVHFDCVLAFLQGAENLAANEKLVYIGHGRFAVMVFENPSDTRKFKIIRTIEWENRDTKAEWRSDISGRFSQVK